MKTSAQIDSEFSHCSFNGRLLLKELTKYNIQLIPIGKTGFVKAQYKNHSELLFELYTSRDPYVEGVMMDDKYYAKKILQKNGFNTAEGEVFKKNEINKALSYASNHLGFPIVLKPTQGAHGDFVYLDIDSEEKLKQKIEYLLSNYLENNGFFLIEKQYDNLNEYRIFIAKNGFFAAVSRIPANIIGNGKASLKTLIKKENYRRMNPRNTCLCEIRLDDITYDFLKKQNLTLNYVPQKGEQIFLRKNSNVSTGGNCYNVSEVVHPSVIELAKEVLAVWENSPYIGIDLLCKDISKPLDKYLICELNSSPGLSMHMMPEKGNPINVAKAITQVLFPEVFNEK